MTPTLYPYQDAGAAFLAQRRRAMLLDEPGLGKTAQAIEACNRIGAREVLVVCPASLRTNWRREFARFGTGQSVTVESYDIVARDWQKFHTIWDALILDEAHYLKSPSAKRTQAIYGGKHFPGLVSMSARVFALTGTPAPNHPGEMFTHMAALAPESLAMASDATRRYDHWSFVQRYCNVVQTSFGSKITGARNRDDLKARIAPWVLRRRKVEVLQDLPEIRYEELSLDAPAAAKALKEVPDAAMQAIRVALETGDAAGLAGLSEHVATLRRVTGMAKAAAVADWVDDFLEQTGRKIVIFAHHRAVIDELYKRWSRRGSDADRSALGAPVVRIVGESRPDQRQNAVDRFQNDDHVRVFIGQIQAAGTGITLTAASDLIFVEQSWVPAENAQAAMRIHRIGQRNGCLVRFATLAGSIDEAVQRALARKTRDLDYIFG